jgi:hypothetical protein
MDAAATAKPLSVEQLVGGINLEEVERVRKLSLAEEEHKTVAGHELEKSAWLDAAEDPVCSSD